MAMFGVDVYHGDFENGFNINKVKADFLICKASQGNSYVDNTLNSGLKAAEKAGKLLGAYHFATGKSSGKEEADHFLSVVKSWIGKALLVLDWEAGAVEKGPGYAKVFSDRVYEKTGIKPILYCSTSTINSSWKEYASKYPYVWGARYGSNKVIHGYTNDIYAEGCDISPFKKEIIRQYSDKTYLSGYSGELDANKCYISKDEWKKLCGKSSNKTTDDTKKDDKKNTKPKLSVEEVAKKIINGTDGWNVTGEARRKKLRANGYDPDEVQARVNKLLK